MNTLDQIRKGKQRILALGSHSAIIQSILDFDFLSGKQEPSVVGIVTANRKAEKYFFGSREVLIPCVARVADADASAWMLNLQSGRRAYASTLSFFEAFPRALGGHIFAENVPEKHALELVRRYGEKRLILGPSGVGLLVPGSLKLGAIGGVDLMQLAAGKITTPGSIAVISTSGGMTNELIRAVASAGHRLSFAAAVGGDRFPIASLSRMFALAEEDQETKSVVYFGELGGADEYEIIKLIQAKKFTKPLVAYIAGVIDEVFADHVQFGHAKALVAHIDESARAKREALRAAGVVAPDTFPEFLKALAKLSTFSFSDDKLNIQNIMNRTKSILSTREVLDPAAPVKGPFARAALEALLAKPVKSKITVAFVDTVFAQTLDHGGQVSGAVNTMITARAGKDLVSSLASGLLTIGPRFGGAVNAAAKMWLTGVSEGIVAKDFVEMMAKRSELIAGIGHRKYRVGVADPRVASIAKFAKLVKKHPHYDFARAVEKVTTGKNGKLILNVDGVIAALALDILSACEGLSERELKELAEAEFFNAFFVIPRSVGFIAHFLEQKRNDEGLFRLPDEFLFVRKLKKR